MRLLLVEDDFLLSKQLRGSLTNAGYAVDLSTDGLDAEAMGDIEPYDIIILDLGLPKRSGLDVLKNWRKRGNRIPVIILTARGSWQEKVDGFNAGADDYLAKPFQLEELLARIKAVVNRSHGQVSNMLSFGSISLDESTRELIIDNQQHHKLTGMEFRLMRYFMLHQGQLLSKSRLTEHVYEYDQDKDSNVIEVYVNRLRQIIGNQYITTRRGQGYIFGIQ